MEADDAFVVDRATFEWTVKDFLFQTVWATKHLRRGNLWQVKDDVDGYMKRRLLSMIEWQARARGDRVATWSGPSSGGRDLEVWASADILEALPATFATYDSSDVARALLATMALFERSAVDVADAFGYSYPSDRHDTLEAWVRAHLQAHGYIAGDP